MVTTQNTLETERPNPIIVFILIAALIAGIIYITVNFFAGITSSEYGMSTNEVRSEIAWIIFYFFIAAFLSIVVAKIPISPYIKIVTMILIFAAATRLADYQISTSKCLAAVKNEFANVAPQDCHVIARGVMRCGKKVTAVLEKRDRLLNELGMKMLNDWRVTSPYPGMLDTHMAGAYVPMPW